MEPVSASECILSYSSKRVMPFEVSRCRTSFGTWERSNDIVISSLWVRTAASRSVPDVGVRALSCRGPSMAKTSSGACGHNNSSARPFLMSTASCRGVHPDAFFKHSHVHGRVSKHS